jgi:hypothetical protein
MRRMVPKAPFQIFESNLAGRIGAALYSLQNERSTLSPPDASFGTILCNLGWKSFIQHNMSRGFRELVLREPLHSRAMSYTIHPVCWCNPLSPSQPSFLYFLYFLHFLHLLLFPPPSPFLVILPTFVCCSRMSASYTKQRTRRQPGSIVYSQSFDVCIANNVASDKSSQSFETHSWAMDAWRHGVSDGGRC